MNDSSPEQDLFLRACGTEGGLRLTVEGPSGTERHSLPQPFALIGYSPRADLGAGVWGLHRRHVYLQFIAGRLFCIDLAHPDRPALPRFGWLEYGQSLRIGPLLIRYPKPSPAPLLPPFAEDPSLPDLTRHHGHPAPRRPSGLVRPPFDEDPSLPEATIEIATKGTPVRWKMRRPLALVGSSAGCKVRLVGLRVSRYHCALVGTAAGLWAVDLLGRAGIAVNGSVVRSARLEHGDELTMGGFLLRVRFDTPSPEGALVEGTQAADSTVTVREGSGAEMVRTSDPPGGSWLSDGTVTIPGGPPVLGLPGALPTLALQLAQFQQQMFEQFQESMAEMISALTTAHRDQVRLIQQELERVQELSRELAVLRSELARRSAPGPVPPPPPNDRALGRLPPAAPVPSRPAAPGPAPEAGGQPAPDVHDWLLRRVAAVQLERKKSWFSLSRLLAGTGGDKPAAPPP
jgi:hypothetical protein